MSACVADRNSVLIKRELEDSTNSKQKQKTNQEKSSKSSVGKRWTTEQDEALKKAVEEFGPKNWKAIAERVPDRNHAQCLQRWNKVLKPGLVKGHWSFEEDSILERMVLQGCHSWQQVSSHIPGRTAKQCRERWRNHLDPSISKEPYTPEEDKVLQEMYEELGNRWTQIADRLPGRTEDSVKLRWKVLNPNPSTKAKPGRPRLMPGMSATKSRPTAPPTPIEVAAARSNTENAGNPSVYYPQDAQGNIQRSEANVTPIDEDVLTQSARLSCLSIGSITSFPSLSDMSPEELLASGEFENLLKSGNLKSFESNPSLVDSFSKAIQSMENKKDQEALQEFLSEIQASQQAMQQSQSDDVFNGSQAHLQPTPQVPSYRMSDPKTYQSSCNSNSTISSQVTAATRDIDDIDNPEMLQSFSARGISRPIIPSHINVATNNIDDICDPSMLKSFKIEKPIKGDGRPFIHPGIEGENGSNSLKEEELEKLVMDIAVPDALK